MGGVVSSIDMNKVLSKDIQKFVDTFELANELSGRRFLITGATGLVGAALIRCLLALNRGIEIVAPVRDLAKAKAMFAETPVRLVECDIVEYDYDSIGGVDYVVHCAAPTASKHFIEYPVETANVIYKATEKLLHFCAKHSVKGFLFVSSMEVYGTVSGKEMVTEDMQGYLNPMDVRSSYPMAKRMAENLCCLYASEYGVNATIARLSQTTGAGVAKNDLRAITQFVRCAVDGKDIVLHTEGVSARPYCYTTDAVSAFLYILLRGEKGQAYNVANEETYTSIRALVERVKALLNDTINISVEIDNSQGYAPESFLPLSTGKLQSLGWMPQYDLDHILMRLADYLKDYE
jgi:nucleoside-diphosphate-sugar epimerase